MEELQLLKNDRTGKIASAVITFIFLVLFVYNWPLDKAPEPPPSIMIAFGDDDLGMNDDADPFAEDNNTESPAEENVAEEIPETQPVAEPAVKDVVTDDASPIPVPKKEVKPQTPTKPTKPVVTKPTKPVKEEGTKSDAPKKPIGVFTGKTGGKGKGDNDTPGPTGDKDGTGNSTTGGSVGGDIGGGLSGRRVESRSMPTNNSGQYGTVVIEVCVDIDGKVVEARATGKGSTTANGSLVSLAEAAAKKFRFERSPNAPDKECGTITFKFLPG